MKSDKILNRKRFVYETFATMDLYEQRIRNYQNKVNNKYNIGNKLEGYELDHKFSIAAGYYYGLAPWMLVYPGNVEWINEHENKVKHKKSSLSLTDFIKEFGEWVKDNKGYIKWIIGKYTKDLEIIL